MRRASAMYQPWTGGNMDEGWTRWVLEQYQFNLTSIHNADIRAGKLRAEVRRDHHRRPGPARDHRRLRRAARSVPSTAAASATTGVDPLQAVRRRRRHAGHDGQRLRPGDRALPIPVRNLKKGLTRDQHFAPGAILNARGRHPAPDRLRRRRRHLRLLHQQPVLPADRRLQLAALQRGRALPEHGRRSPRAG